MARLPRLCPAGMPQHVIQRGNNRQVCFNNDEDFMTLDLAIRSGTDQQLSAASTLTSGAFSVGLGAGSARLATMSGGGLAANMAWGARGELAAFAGGNIVSSSFGW